MINSLHKKIVLALLLTIQIVKPMEQKPLGVSNYSSAQCQGPFAIESFCAVMSLVGNMVIGSNITNPRDVWQKELSVKDKLIAGGVVCSGLSIGASFVLKSMNDNFKYLIERCDRDNQQLAFTRGIVWLSIVTCLMQHTGFIQRKAINQLRQAGNFESKVAWDVIKKQVGLYDLLVYVIGIGLLYMFPAVSAS